MNKIILLSLLISILLTGAFYTFNSSSDEEVQSQRKSLIFERKGLKKHTITSDSPKLQFSNLNDQNILTYNVNLGLGIEEIDADKETDSHQTNEIKTVAHVQVDYVSDLKLFELVIAYSKYQQDTYVDDVNVEDSTDFEFEKDQEIFEFNNILVYKLLVEEESGEILSMYALENMEQNDLIQWGTQELVNSIFPDIRSGSYLNDTPLEEDSIGQYKPHIKEITTSDEIIQLEKHYDSNDYSEFVVEGVIAPSVDFNRTLFVDQNTGVVLGGDSEYEYTLGQENTDTHNSDGELFILIDSSQMEIEIKTNFYLQSEDSYTRDQAQNMLNFLQNSEYQFVQIQLAKQKKGENLMNEMEEEELETEEEIDQEFQDDEDQKIEEEISESEKIEEEEENSDDKIEEEDQKLTAPVIHTEKTKLIALTVLQQQIEYYIITKVTSTQTNIYSQLYVNGRGVKLVFDQKINHCQNFYKNFFKSTKAHLFKAVWPVGGLVVLPVKAYAQFGFNFNINARDQKSQCNYEIRPSISAELYGDGKVSLAGIISAGLYAKGKFLASNLTLSSNINKSSGKIDLNLSGNILPASFEFGCVYGMFTCDDKKIFDFIWKHICKLKKQRHVPFITKSLKSYKKTFFKKTLFK